MSPEGKDTEPSIGEVIASIRRILADDTAAARAMNGGGLPSSAYASEEPLEDFDLPAIFRTNSDGQGPKGVPPLPGRHMLLSPILPALPLTPSAPAKETVAGAGQRPIASEAETASIPPHFAPAPDIKPSAPPSTANRAALADTPSTPWLPGAAGDDVPRKMVSCKDTLMARMGAPVSTFDSGRSPGSSNGTVETGALCGVWPFVHEPLPPGAPTPADFSAPPEAPLVPAGCLGARNFLLGESALDPDAAPDDAAPLAQITGIGQTPGEAAPSPVLKGAIEEATASLLRPLLRQWLDENMQRVFSRALHIEAEVNSKTDVSEA